MPYQKEVLFFSDLDGTLLGNNHFFSKNTKEKVKALFNQGYMLIPITARTTHDAFLQAKRLQLDTLGGIVVASNGSQIYDFKSQKYIVNKYLPRKIVEKVFEDTYNKYEAKVNFYGDDVTYVFNEGKNSLQWAQIAALDYVITHDVAEIEKPITHLTIILKKNTPYAKAQAYARKLHKDYGRQTAILAYSDRVYELSPPRTSKGEAVRIISEHLKIDPQITKTYGFGDGANDVSLFDSVDVGVAMANANSELMDIADDVTTETNNEDGVVKYIEQRVMNK